MPRSGGAAVSVFISYRREGGSYLAKIIYDHLRRRKYDVFMDLHQLGAGQFEQETLTQIRSRDYFVIVLTTGSLDRMKVDGDWLRREFLTARKADRTIIPLLDADFSFDAPEVKRVLAALPKSLNEISTYNAVRMPPPEYLDEGLKRLRQFLAKKASPALEPPTHSKELAEAQLKIQAQAPPPPSELARDQLRRPSWSELEHSLFGSTGSWHSRVLGAGLPKLQDLQVPLPAPELRIRPHTPAMMSWSNTPAMMSWTNVEGATAYLLEYSSDAAFSTPVEVYKGSDLIYSDDPAYSTPEYYSPLKPPFDSSLEVSAARTGRLKPGYYRVKATSGSIDRADSPWSDSVNVSLIDLWGRFTPGS